MNLFSKIKQWFTPKSNTGRRGFLKTVGVAAAVVATGGLWRPAKACPFAQREEAINSINAFTRTKMRQESFFRRVLPPLQISEDQLDKQIPTPNKNKDIFGPYKGTPKHPESILLKHKSKPISLSELVEREHKCRGFVVSDKNGNDITGDLMRLQGAIDDMVAPPVEIIVNKPAVGRKTDDSLMFTMRGMLNEYFNQQKCTCGKHKHLERSGNDGTLAWAYLSDVSKRS